jgi:RAB6A-GEF complex partner protein 1
MKFLGVDNMVTNLQSSLLQSHDVFTEYLDLLNILEEELSSVSDLTLQNGPLS